MVIGLSGVRFGLLRSGSRTVWFQTDIGRQEGLLSRMWLDEDRSTLHIWDTLNIEYRGKWPCCTAFEIGAWNVFFINLVTRFWKATSQIRCFFFCRQSNISKHWPHSRNNGSAVGSRTPLQHMFYELAFPGRFSVPSGTLPSSRCSMCEHLRFSVLLASTPSRTERRFCQLLDDSTVDVRP